MSARTALVVSALVVTALVTLAAGPVASAEEFTGGHIFVAGASADNAAIGRVSEFDSEGVHIRDIDINVPDTGNELRGLAFGPDGQLLVAILTGDRVDQISPAGTVDRYLTEGSVDDPSFLTFGPDGDLYMGARAGGDGAGTIQRYFVNSEFGFIQPIILPTSIVGADSIAFTPSGRRVVSIFTNFAGDSRLSAFDSTFETEIPLDVGVTLNEFPGNPLEGPGGAVFVADCFDAEILRAGPAAGTSTSFTVPELTAGLSCPFAMTMRENRNLLVTAFLTHQILEIPPGGSVVVDTIEDIGLLNPAGLAIAPFAFKSTLNGSFVGDGLRTKRIRQPNIRVSVGVDDGRVIVHFPEDGLRRPVQEAIDQGVLGRTAVMRGFVVGRPDDPRRRILHASNPVDQIGDSPHSEIVLELFGKEDENGRFIPKRFRGTFHQSAEFMTLGARVSGRLLK